MTTPRSIFGFGLSILLVVTAAAIGLDLKSRYDSVWVDHTVDVLRRLSDIRLLVRDAESAARGYALFDDPKLAAEYRTAVSQIAPSFRSLKDTITSNAYEASLVAQTETLVGRRLAVTSEGVRRQSIGDSAGLSELIHTMTGRDLMGTINANFDQLLTDQRRQLDARDAGARRTRMVLLAIDVTGAFLILLFAALLIRDARRSSRDMEQSLRVTEAVNQTLEAAVDERTKILLAAHEDLRHSVAILQSTFNSMAEAVLVIDTRGEVILSNQAAEKILLFRPGVSSKQMRERNRAYQPDGVTELTGGQRPIDRAIRGETFERVEIVLRQRNRRDPLHILVSSRPLYDSIGAVSGAALVYHDITGSYETERKLQQAQKLDAIGKLTGGVAHDFNNMLTVITGTTETLLEHLKDRPEALQTAALIDSAAARCGELIKHLLAFARQQPLQPRNVDVNHTVVDLAKLLRPTLGEQIEIKTVLQPNLPATHVDPSQLAHALLNLSINARDAMPNGGMLVLETRDATIGEASLTMQGDIPPGHYVEIIVSDNGTGMTPAIRDKVFEPFFTTKDAGKGSGLGLSMVYGFVRQSGGYIHINSEPGQGTSIRFYLPPASGVAETTVVDQAPLAPGGTETILVVEDDAMVANFVTAQLRSLGYKTVTVTDSHAALAVIERGQRFDLLFTDIVMPGGITGRELAELVSQRRSGTKVLFTTGYADTAMRSPNISEDNIIVLPKPYRKAQLARMVRQAIDGNAIENQARETQILDSQPIESKALEGREVVARAS
jgi:PAS domain S-box-containing protein